eukprot:30962-Pelagococcus_subviridis.AAC.4
MWSGFTGIASTVRRSHASICASKASAPTSSSPTTPAIPVPVRPSRGGLGFFVVSCGVHASPSPSRLPPPPWITIIPSSSSSTEPEYRFPDEGSPPPAPDLASADRDVDGSSTHQSTPSRSRSCPDAGDRSPSRLLPKRRSSSLSVRRFPMSSPCGDDATPTTFPELAPSPPLGSASGPSGARSTNRGSGGGGLSSSSSRSGMILRAGAAWSGVDARATSAATRRVGCFEKLRRRTCHDEKNATSPKQRVSSSITSRRASP